MFVSSKKPKFSVKHIFFEDRVVIKKYQKGPFKIKKLIRLKDV
jgi:hypothetical protein